MSEEDKPKEGDEMGIQFENKVNIGHILTAGVLLVTGAAAFTHVKAEVARVSAEVIVISADHKQSEARIRAVEIAQASQSSTLQSIQGGIARIELQLEKLSKN